MAKYLKIFFCLIFLFDFFLVNFASAQKKDEIFEAEVIAILEQREVVDENGQNVLQQNIKLNGLSGSYQGKEIIFRGIDDYLVTKNNAYVVGDRVLVAFSPGPSGEEIYYITDYARYRQLYWLTLFFFLLVILIGRWKGLRALIGLFASFFVIMKFIVPKILAGSDPLAVSLLGSFIILLLAVYLSEGFNRKSHLAVLSIVFSLFIVAALSAFFVKAAGLTGLAQEETMFLITYGQHTINFRGLLLAGMIIGALGILDDIVISQIASVAEIKKTNHDLSNKEIYHRAMTIGIAHMSSMTNTLFLVYAGASLPLLLLFNVNEPPFLTFSQIINNETLAVEIIRTLSGSIGLLFSVPISSYLASHFLSVKKQS